MTEKEYQRTKTKLEFVQALCLTTVYVGMIVIGIVM